VINLIKVDAIGSTNCFLKELINNKTINQTTCVWAKNQTNGRGQMGNSWNVEGEKNLTFSVYMPINDALAKNIIAINLITSLSIFKVLKLLNIPQLYIKWPNDIMSANKKIGGILIENNYQNGALSDSIIGIGINVNQEKFKNLPYAGSLKLSTQKEFDLETLLNQILKRLEKSFTNYNSIDFSNLKKEFESVLFRKGKASSFTKANCNSIFTGIIKGITNDGRLIVLKEDNITQEFSLKEISLLY